MNNDPWKNFYIKGFEDMKASKRVGRVPQNYKLSYHCGRHDAAANKPNRYEVENDK